MVEDNSWEYRKFSTILGQNAMLKTKKIESAQISGKRNPKIWIKKKKKKKSKNFLPSCLNHLDHLL
jgi:hypothetical protein